MKPFGVGRTQAVAAATGDGYGSSTTADTAGAAGGTEAQLRGCWRPSSRVRAGEADQARGLSTAGPLTAADFASLLAPSADTRGCARVDSG